MGKLGRRWAVLCALALAACGGEPSAAERAAPGQVQQAAVVAPSITTFSPLKAVQGTLVTINGQGFSAGASVSFNGTQAASVTFVSSTRLRAIVPTGATSGPISVTVPAGAAVSPAAFGVLPKVKGVEPMRAFAGDFVAVAGSGFTGTTGVKFGTVATTFEVTSDAGITAAVPAGFSSGKVTVTTPSGSSATTSTFLALPLVTGFAPTQGLVGQSVSISGDGLSLATAVKFGAKPAAFSVLSNVELSAVVPAGAASGKITVETPRGNRTSAATFTVIKTPIVSSFTPLSAELPATLTISGSNFVTVSAVKVGSVTLPSFSVVTSKQLTAPVPRGTPSGKVSVVNAAGTGTSKGTFVAIPCSDADLDGVCDVDDRCPGFDDRVDTDQDGTADGCDICPSSVSARQSCGTGMECDFAGACVERLCHEHTQGPGVLRGDVIIDSVDTAGDLARLDDIWCVSGNLSIAGTSLVDLSALGGVLEVGGSLSIGTGCRWPCAYRNQQLESLHGLEGLRRIGQALVIEEGGVGVGLQSLSGLSGLRQVESLFISTMVRLQHLQGLEGLSAPYYVRITDSPTISSLSGLENLRRPTWLVLMGLPQLVDISALSGMTELSGGLQIAATGLGSLHGLESLSSAGTVDMGSNPNLSDLSALANLRTLSSLSLYGAGVDSLAAFSQIEELERLFLGEVALTSLHELSNLKRVDRLEVVSNQLLSSLTVGDVLVTTDLQIENNPALTGCDGLSVSTGAEVEIRSNPLFSSISCIQGATDLASLQLEGTYGITSLAALSSLTHAGSLVVWGLGEVRTLTGLHNLQSLDGTLTLGNLPLLDLQGLESLTSVGSLDLRDNLALRSISGMDKLAQVQYWASLDGNWNLSQCEIAGLEAQIGRPLDSNVGNGPACAP